MGEYHQGRESAAGTDNNCYDRTFIGAIPQMIKLRPDKDIRALSNNEGFFFDIGVREV